MKLSTYLLAGASALLIAACSQGDDSIDVEADAPPAETEVSETDTTETETPAPEASEGDIVAPAATYSLERSHAFLSFTVIHNGLSEYTVDFTDFDATLDFDPDAPEDSSLTATIDPLGLNVNYRADYKAGHPDSEYDNWPEALSKDARFLNATEFPEITFVSTDISTTGDNTGTVTGDLTFLGVTRPVTLDVTYNGAGSAPWYGERTLIGFDASTTLNRSEFGQDSMSGVISDEVVIEFSGEFLENEE
ncbi:YceI family protein [Henriciella sp. AS95]|uniref:YceI family protein n=1 Tax=Henriciella sp. AS95 TaxID=3135782 RepID=UPI003181A5AE